MQVRIGVLIPAIIVFILSAALYMDVDMGTAPYDAIPIIISDHLPKAMKSSSNTKLRRVAIHQIHMTVV